jgi:nucleolar protein 56
MASPFEHNGKRFKTPEEAATAFFKGNFTARKPSLSETDAVKKRYVKDHNEFVLYMNRFCSELTKLKLESAFPKTVMITHVTNGIDEIDKILNVLYERADEMYAMYFPEAAKMMETLDVFAKTLADGISRQEVSKKLDIPSESMGIDLDSETLEMLGEYVTEITMMLKLRERLVDYVEHNMKSLCQNITALCGAMLGAKLLALAGSLEKLARMPSSTIQVLGAEKALFRHLRSGAKPPKHGIILQHPFVAKAKNRGKAARKLASKIAIAAKMDHFQGKNIGKELRKEIEGEMK